MNMNGKAVAISTVGYMCLAVMGWMISMTFASWFPGHFDMAFLYPLVIVLGVMGILSFFEGRSLDAIVFFGGTALFSSAFVQFARLTEPSAYLGWFAILWAVVFAYVWVGSFKSGVARMLFLLGLWLAMTSLAIGGWSGAHGWVILAGYIGLITSIVAGATSASEIIRFGMVGDPNVPNVPNVPRVEAPRPMAAD